MEAQSNVGDAVPVNDCPTTGVLDFRSVCARSRQIARSTGLRFAYGYVVLVAVSSFVARTVPIRTVVIDPAGAAAAVPGANAVARLHADTATARRLRKRGPR